MKKHFIPELILIFICFIWGVTFVVVQDAIKELPPYSFLATRFLIALILLWSINKIFIKQNIWQRSAIIGGIIIGIFLFIGFALQTFSLLYTTSGKSGFFTGINVAFVPLVGFLLYRQRTSLAVIIGVICSIIGLYFLSGSIVGMNLGDILAFGCAICFAFQLAITGHYAKNTATYPLVIWQLVTVSFCSLIMIPFHETIQPSAFLKPIVVSGILITAVLATVFAFVAQTSAQQNISATRVAIIFVLEPVFAALADYIVNGITLSPMELTGCAIILTGILLAEIPWTKTKKATVITPELE